MSDVTSDGIDHEWQRWAAIMLLNEIPVTEVVETMVAEGIDEREAARACAQCFGNPFFEAGKHSTQQLRKLESVLDMLQKMRDLSPAPRAVDRRSGLSRDEFLNEYYALNRPVILDDVCNDWSAREVWDADYLVGVLGHEEVEVQADRESDPEYELNSDEHKFRMPFDEYVSKITSVGSSNDFYLVANNGLLSTAAASPLWEDFREDVRYLAKDRRHKHTYLWFGPGGTITPLHHDSMNILFQQVKGTKDFIMVSPLETHLVYNNVSVYSDVDAKSPDLELHNRYALAHPLRFTMEPGEALFIPVGWWHHVEARDLSVSVSSTNFAFANDVDLFDPDRL